MKKFCESLRKHTMKIINFKQKKMVSLTTNRQKNKNLLHLQRERKYKQYNNDKKDCRVRDHCHYTGKSSRIPRNLGKSRKLNLILELFIHTRFRERLSFAVKGGLFF